jgi:hypothetical protein
MATIKGPIKIIAGEEVTDKRLVDAVKANLFVGKSIVESAVADKHEEEKKPSPREETIAEPKVKEEGCKNCTPPIAGDLNKDSVFDVKDASLAGKVMAKWRKKKKAGK